MGRAGFPINLPVGDWFSWHIALEVYAPHVGPLPMDRDLQLKKLQASCLEIDPVIIRDFVFRMDPEYFQHFSHRETAAHLHLAKELSTHNPCTVSIQERKGRIYDIVIVAYDYFAEFATFCGVLGSFGIEIQEAFITTYGDPLPRTLSGRRSLPRSGESAWQRPRPPQTPGLARKKIVDVFRVRLMEGYHLGRHEQQQLHENLLAMTFLLDKGQLQETRRQVNRRLIKTLGQLKWKPADLSHLVEIQFENDTVWDYTVISIHSQVSAVFLYIFVNALTMRGLYIARATVSIIRPPALRLTLS